jgi:hypothetical protein
MIAPPLAADSGKEGTVTEHSRLSLTLTGFL